MLVKILILLLGVAQLPVAASPGRTSSSDLLWENIDRVDGASSRHSRAAQRHYFDIGSDASVTVMLPADRTFRLDLIEGHAGDFTLFAGDGGGLFSARQLQQQSERSWLLPATLDSRYLLIENQALQAITVSMFQGQARVPGTAPLALSADLVGAGSAILRQSDQDRRRYVFTEPDQPAELIDYGRPLLLEARRLSPGSGNELQPLVLKLRSATVFESRTLDIQPSSRQPVLLDGCWQLAGPAARTLLQPTGLESGRWQVAPVSPSVLRITQPHGSWLWPGLNSDSDNWLPSPDALAGLRQSYRKQLGLALASGAKFAESAALQTALELDPDQTSVGDRERFWRRHTSWRPLAGRSSSGRLKSQRTRVRRIQGPNPSTENRPPAHDLISARQRLELAPVLDWVQLRPGTAIDFPLPRQILDSNLRLWVQLGTGLLQEQEFALSIDDGQPIRLFLRPSERGVSTHIDAALVTLQTVSSNHDNRRGNKQFPPQLLQYPWVDALQTILPVERLSNTVSVQLPATAEAIWIAVQYRRAKRSNLTEQQALELVSKPTSLWQSLQAALHGDIDPDDQWQSQLARLARLIEIRAEGFLDDIQDYQPLNLPWSTNTPMAEPGWTQLPDTRDSSWSEILAGLDREGELGLRRRLLKGLAVYGQVAEIRESARQVLARDLAQDSSALVWQGLLATRIRDQNDQQALLDLAISLKAAGQASLALITAMAAPIGPGRLNALNDGALAKGWRRLFAATVNPASESPGRTLANYDRAHDLELVDFDSVDPVTLQAKWRVADNTALASSWQAWPMAPSQHAGQYLVDYPARELNFLMWSVSPQIPLLLPVSGPAELRVVIRPLHAASAVAIDAAVQILVGDTRQTINIRHNTIADRFLPIGDPRAVGEEVRQIVQLENGDGILKITSPIPILVSVQVKDDPLALKRHPRMTPVLSTWLEQPLWRKTPTTAVRTIDECRLDKQHLTAFLPQQPQATHLGKLGLLSAQLETDFDAMQIAWADFPEQRKALWQQALGMAQEQIPTAATASLRRLGQGRWQRLDQVIRSAGLVTETVSGWQPESLSMSWRHLLLQPQPDDWLVANEKVTALQLDSLEANQLQLELQLKRMPFAVPGSAQVQLSYADQKHTITVLDGQVIRQTFMLPAGLQEIRLQRLDRWLDQVVTARVLRRNENQWEPIDRSLRRDYHVSTGHQPVAMYLDQASWLRINTWDGKNHQVSYRFVNEAGEIEIPPMQAAEQTYYRVFRYQPKWADVDSPPGQVVRRAREGTPAAPFGSHAKQLATHHSGPLAQAISTGSQDSTWGFGLAFLQRQELDGGNEDELEQFAQLDWTWRNHLSNWASYWQSELLLRDHQQGEAVLGTRQWLDWQPDQTPWRLSLFGSFYQQKDQLSGHFAHSLLLRAKVIRQLEWSDRWRHRTEIGVFGRQFDRDAESVADFSLIDQDVATVYKLSHQDGWHLSERITWRLGLDSELYGTARLGGNPWSNTSLIDQFSVSSGWRNYLRGLTVDSGLRFQRLLADDDRLKASNRTRLFTNIDWRDWPGARWGWQARLGLVYDLDREQTSFLLRLAWIDDDGRGVRDFRPNSLSFRPLHNRRVQWRDSIEAEQIESVIH